MTRHGLAFEFYVWVEPGIEQLAPNVASGMRPAVRADAPLDEPYAKSLTH